MATQTDKAAAQATNNQSQTRSVNKVQLSENEQSKQWSLKFQQSKVCPTTAGNDQTVQNKLDIKTIECIEKDDPSDENLQLTTRWREIAKPGGFRFTQGQWKEYSPSRALRAGQKWIEVELWQKRNKLLWNKMRNSGKNRRRIRTKAKISQSHQKTGAQPKKITGNRQ